MAGGRRETIDRSNLPQAHSLSFYLCEDPQCQNVHVILRDERRKPFAECTVNVEMVGHLQNVLYQKATMCDSHIEEKKMEWEMLHPKMTMEHLGLIPEFLFEDDPRPAREQFDKRYVAGWTPFKGFEMLPGNKLKYPGDPPFAPSARAVLHADSEKPETILFYQSGSWVLIMQKDGSWEVSRMD